jgi:hypothetical protein
MHMILEIAYQLASTQAAHENSEIRLMRLGKSILAADE